MTDIEITFHRLVKYGCHMNPQNWDKMAGLINRDIAGAQHPRGWNERQLVNDQAKPFDLPDSRTLKLIDCDSARFPPGRTFNPTWTWYEDILLRSTLTDVEVNEIMTDLIRTLRRYAASQRGTNRTPYDSNDEALKVRYVRIRRDILAGIIRPVAPQNVQQIQPVNPIQELEGSLGEAAKGSQSQTAGGAKPKKKPTKKTNKKPTKKSSKKLSKKGGNKKKSTK